MFRTRQTLASQRNLEGMLAKQFNDADEADGRRLARFENGNVKPACHNQRRQWRRRRIKRFG